MRAPLALTMGEPAGIGGEITLRAWYARREAGIPPFFTLADPNELQRLAETLGLKVPVRRITGAPEAASCFEDGLPVLPITLARPVLPGTPDIANESAVLEAITMAVSLVRAGQASALVTNPIQKESLYAAGYRHPGHTEFLAELVGGVRPVMMLACPGLRVVPVTIHLALREAVAALRREDIVACGRITAEALTRHFGVS
ncbi:MAG TPA: 4-hydroxythreonine-4-phosphate dehydrogenase PdxA, partial [Stellaceae bacterium]|nr:4-hydroxythreonine-4-phosphate dehydrogenase PdxA [Stellaceae bacterium]